MSGQGCQMAGFFKDPHYCAGCKVMIHSYSTVVCVHASSTGLDVISHMKQTAALPVAFKSDTAQSAW